MRLRGSWLAMLGIGATLAIASPCSAHQQIGLKLDQLNAEITEHPNDAELYVQRSDLYRLNREWALAEADLETAVGLTPDDPDLQFYLGRLWFEAGRPAPARSALDRFIAARPGHVPGLVIRGRVLGALGDRLAAAADYDRVIARLDAARARTLSPTCAMVGRRGRRACRRSAYAVSTRRSPAWVHSLR